MKKILLYIIVSLTAVSTAQSQTAKKYAKLAIESYDEEQFASAFTYAEEALSLNDSLPQQQFIAGVSAYHLRLYPAAIHYLNGIIDNSAYGSYHSASYLNLARTYLILGDHDRVAEMTEPILGDDGVDPVIMEKAQRVLDQSIWAMEHGYSMNSDIEATPWSQGNTLDSDFPIDYNNGVLRYVTNVLPKEHDNACGCMGPCDAYMDWKTSTSGNGIYFPTENDRIRHFTYDGRNHRLYFIDCTCNNNRGESCGLFFQEQSSNAGWSEKKQILQQITDQGYQIKQPHLVGSIERNGVDTLYFVSDLQSEGAKGGLDIWYVTIQEEKISEPINFSRVNTPHDEITPFYHKGLKTFFFSSDRPEALGGFDIYRMRKSHLDDWCDVEHLSLPYSSSFDDNYFVLNDAGDEAFFSTNRSPSTYLEADTNHINCCADIFQASYPPEPPTDLFVKVRNAFTLEPMPEAKVYASRKYTDQIPELLNTDVPAMYKIADVRAGQAYIAEGEAEGYKPDLDSISFSTYVNCEPIASDTIVLDLIPILNLQVTVFDTLSGDQITDATVVLEKEERGALASVQTIEGANDGYSGTYLVEDISFDTVYNVRTNTLVQDTVLYVLNADGVPVDPRDLPREPQTIEETLYLFPLFFNPIELFFNHDIPSRQLSLYDLEADTLAFDDYGAYYENYVENPGNIRRYKLEQCPEVTEGQVQGFFDEAASNMESLEKLADRIIRVIDEVASIQLIVTGFASKAGERIVGYNKALSARRSNSILKYLERRFEEKGVDLAQFDEKLSIILESKGADPDQRDYCVGDNFNRIYDLGAARARRVTISEIKIKPLEGN